MRQGTPHGPGLLLRRSDCNVLLAISMRLRMGRFGHHRITADAAHAFDLVYQRYQHVGVTGDAGMAGKMQRVLFVAGLEALAELV
jgi:hypothetical protein